jgi:hypothetical protein
VAKRIQLLAESEADRAARVGVAEALAIEEQVRAYGGPQYQLVQEVMNRFAEAIEKSQVDVVPKIQMGGSQGSSSLIESLLTLLMTQKVGESMGVAVPTAVSAQAEALRGELRKGMQANGGKAAS